MAKAKPGIMKPEIKKLWVEALRSRKYKQTTNALRDGVGYCCLGVLCDLHQKATGTGTWVVNEDGEQEYKGRPREKLEGGALPESVRKWAGVTACDPGLGDRSASVWNDDERAKFGQIAKLIDKHL